MTNSKHTKRALLASALSLMLCVAMLVGTTFAWFTDTVTSGNNIIKSGNLKVDLIHVGGGADNEDVSLKEKPDHKIFNYDKWEPGYTAMETLKVVTEGDLAFKFRLDAVTVGEITGENGEKLSDVIDVYVYEGEDIPAPGSFADMTDGWRNAGSLSELMEDKDGVARGELLPTGATPKNGEPVGSVQMTVALHMQETAGNEYQGLSLGNLSFTLNAAQYTYEDDSFNDRYDKDAEYNVVEADKDNLQSVLDEVSANTVVQLDEGSYDNFEMRLIGDKGMISEPQNFEYKPDQPYYYHSERKIQNLVIRGVDEKDEDGYYKTEIGRFYLTQGLNKYKDQFPGYGSVIPKWMHTYSSFDIDGLTFENIHFTGQVDLQDTTVEFGTFKNITFKNCTFDASAEDYSNIKYPNGIDYSLPALNSIRVSRIENLVIDGCTFKGNATYWNNIPLYLQSINNLTFTNNTITNCGKNAMHLVTYGGNIVIDGNEFIKTPSLAINFWGNNNGSDIIITDNDFNASHVSIDDKLQIGEVIHIDARADELSLTVSGNKWTPKDGQSIIKGVVTEDKTILDDNPKA